MEYKMKQKAVWVKTITLDQAHELKVSNKGFIGFFSKGRYAGGITANLLALVLTNTGGIRELLPEALELQEARREVSKKERANSKLLKDAEKLLDKAEQFKQAGIDLASILAKKQA